MPTRCTRVLHGRVRQDQWNCHELDPALTDLILLWRRNAVCDVCDHGKSPTILFTSPILNQHPQQDLVAKAEIYLAIPLSVTTLSPFHPSSVASMLALCSKILSLSTSGARAASSIFCISMASARFLARDM